MQETVIDDGIDQWRMPAFELQEDSFNIHRDRNQQKHYQL